MRVLVYSIHPYDRPWLEAAAAGKHELLFTEQPLNNTTADLAAGCEAVALFTSDRATGDVLRKLSGIGVKFIALRSAGFDHVDLEAARALNMKVANVPAYSPYAIAEHAVALLLALNRKLIRSQQLMQKNDFRLDELTGFDLHGKTVGVIGTGTIGSVFAQIMNGFGCTLLGFDLKQNALLKQKYGLRYTDLDLLCRQSDVISIHCPLNAQTKYMFNEPRFALLKQNCLLINTARGGVVDTRALLSALDKGQLAGAGLDVYENEKPLFFYDHSRSNFSDPLFEHLRSHPKVLVTGHQAFLTAEALQGIGETTIKNISRWAQGGRSENELY